MRNFISDTGSNSACYFYSVKVQERNERGKIFPPLLVVEYDELTKDEITENVEVSVEYKVTYSLADDEITNAVEVRAYRYF